MKTMSHAKPATRPTLPLSSADWSRFRHLQWLRCAVAAALLMFVNQLVKFGGLFPFVLCSTLVGILVTGILLGRGIAFLKAAAGHAVLLGLCFGALTLGNIALTSGSSTNPGHDFLIAQLSDEIWLVFIFYLLALMLTYLFWSWRAATTLEAAVLTSFVVWMMSGHRNYHLDAPKQISSLTWNLALLQKYHVEPQHLFIALGCGFALLLGTYLTLASERPLFFRTREVRSYGRRRYLLSFTTVALILTALFSYAWYVNEKYTADLSRATEGVGQNNKEGQSNLGFHSAIGETRQPSALVRLEGDFKQNPWTPMLYLREGALSEFNGKELVNGSNAFDTDVPKTAPGQPYIAGLPPPKTERERVVQSVYLLSKHNSVFAIDVPSRIALIKNPDPERFTIAYQALSEAPTTKVEDLIGRPVGDSKWDKYTWDHYLRSPGSLTPSIDGLEMDLIGEPALDAHGEDMRYRALAQKLVEGVDDPVAKAIAVSAYLSEQSVYTRSPGHTVGPQGDPVAPYLFSEKKRGYCVHFAHAAVYMMRLLGIPARIATGYLTDLTYAKDGHILLHMGDRHAWPEVYIDGYGWTVFDVTPAQAENEQVIVPDEKLLDELMNKLDPAHELITPPEDTKEEQPAPTSEGVLERYLDLANLLRLLITLIVCWILLKLWFRFGYLLAPKNGLRVRLAYLAFSSAATDLGYGRRYGETRREWAHRLKRATGIDGSEVTLWNERRVYGRAPEAVGKGEIRKALHTAVSGFNARLPVIRRFIAFFSPRSVLRRWNQ